MTTEEPTTPAARSSELFQRGPVPGQASQRRRVRRLLRRGVLRVLRPYSSYQHELDAEVVAALEGHEATVKRLQAAIERQQDELERLRTRDSEQIKRLEGLVRELIITAESLRQANANVAKSSGEAVERVMEELHAVPYMNGNPFESFVSPVGQVFGFRARAADQGGTSEYVCFEELFRGPMERVAASQRPYVGLIHDHEPVLDVGCGRGEFLAMLAGEGISASGVDSDAGMVQRSSALGVQVVLGDMNEHLESLPDGALGTIFSAQVIEHLQYDELRRLLALARRKLRPGGLLIAETINPHRVASFKTFWVDLTHEHLIFPEVALAWCAITGFEQAYVFAPGFDSFESARFEAGNYAVVARAPDA